MRNAKVRCGKVLMGCAVLFLVAVSVRGERKYTLGFSTDFMGGGSNRAGNSSFSSSTLSEGLMPYFSVIPTLNLDSKGQHSNLTLSYTANIEQFPSRSEMNSNSHLFNLGFNTPLGKAVRLRLTESVSTMPDFSTVSVITGLVLIPEGFRYVFEPFLARHSSLNNGATGSLECDLTKRSYLTFGLSSNYRHYDQEAANQSYFSDQLRTEGNISFSHKVSQRRTWTVKYSAFENRFKNYSNFRGHKATLGYTEQISPSLQIGIEAGPSFSQKSDLYPESLGYFISANASKIVRANRFSMNYSHRSGDSTGFGYISDSDQGGVGFSRAFGKKTSLNMSLSGFKQAQSLTANSDYWGVSSSLGLTRNLSEHWVATIGGSYQSYEGQVNGQKLAYKRFYASLGYRMPELWRASK